MYIERGRGWITMVAPQSYPTYKYMSDKTQMQNKTQESSWRNATGKWQKHIPIGLPRNVFHRGGWECTPGEMYIGSVRSPVRATGVRHVLRIERGIDIEPDYTRDKGDESLRRWRSVSPKSCWMKNDRETALNFPSDRNDVGSTT